jgi:hypothetical protein
MPPRKEKPGGKASAAPALAAVQEPAAQPPTRESAAETEKPAVAVQVDAAAPATIIASVEVAPAAPPAQDTPAEAEAPPRTSVPALKVCAAAGQHTS